MTFFIEQREIDLLYSNFNKSEAQFGSRIQQYSFNDNVQLYKKVKPKSNESNLSDRKLFIGMISRILNENDIIEKFKVYGPISECKILKDKNGKSRGCAFLTYYHKDSALNAIKSMHRSQIIKNCSSPLNVKFAYNQESRVKEKQKENHQIDKQALTIQTNFSKQAKSDDNSNNLNTASIFQQLINNLNNKFNFETNSETHDSLNNETKSNSNTPLSTPFRKKNTKNKFQQDNSCNSNIQNSENDSLTNSPNSISTKQRTGPIDSNLFIYHLPVSHV